MKPESGKIGDVHRTNVRFSNMGPNDKGGRQDWSRLVEIFQENTKKPSELLQFPGVPTDLTAHDISQFKQSKGKRPRFDHLPWLSAALGKDPGYLARELGMIPPVDEDVARASVEATQRLTELREQAAAIEQVIYRQSSEVLAAIVARANETGRWAVAVWPAIEGPEDCRMHVSDRLDFSRSDGKIGTPQDLWDDLGDVLARANAIRVAPQPRWVENPTPGMAWSIQTALETRGPAVSMPYTGVRSMCVVAQSVTSWASDTASNIALILGYGLDSSRALKVRLYGGERNAIAGEQRGEDVARLRAEIHGNLLLGPTPRTVWYHFGDGRDGKPLYPDPKSAWPTGFFLMRMRESDRLLEWAHRKKDRQERLLAFKDRDEADAAWLELPTSTTLALEVDHPWKAGEDPSELERRDYRRVKSLDSAADALEKILDRGLVSPIAMQSRLAALSRSEASSNERAISSWCENNYRLTYRRLK